MNSKDLERKTLSTILVADDDEKIRTALSDILLMEGYNIIIAKNGLEVLEFVENESIDVILLDINMPGKDGLEITERLKNDERFCHIPIIIVTGHNDIQLRIKALKLGADDFLNKPPHVSELTARVKTLVKVKAYNDYLKNYQIVLEQQVSERTRQLEKALAELKLSSLDTIFRLSRAAEYKDNDTAAHIKRMSRYAVALAKKAGLSTEQVNQINYGSPMHDIGKIGVPDSILMKPGKLEPEEWVIMKKHTLMGGRILEGASCSFLQTGRIIALYHHEKWDGSGYPEGLSGEDIPVEARISAIADVFDALISKRPYKDAMSTEKAFKIIKEERGSHFDPELTDIFLEIRNDIVKILNEPDNN